MHSPSGTEPGAELESTRFRFALERSPILDEIDSHLQQVAELRTRLNTFTDINRLPTELLAKILVVYAKDHYESATHSRTSLSTSPHWIKLTHICRHWREVAFETPRFWSHLYVQLPKTLSALLPLSKSSPLHIDVDLSPYRSRYDPNDTLGWVTASDLIARASHRIRELRCTSKSVEFRTLVEKLTDPMPLLEKLRLQGRVSRDEAILHPIPPLPAVGPISCLRHLELHEVPFTWMDPAFRSPLTTLVIDMKLHGGAQPSIGSFEQFLDILQAIAPSIVHLTLEDSVPQLQSSTTEPPPLSRQPIALASLRSLSLVCNTNDCTHLMDHLLVNPAARLGLRGKGKTGMGRLTRILAAHSARSTPLLALQMIIDVQPWASERMDITVAGNKHDKMPNSPHCEDPPMTYLAFSGTGMSERALLGTVFGAADTLFSNVQSLSLCTCSEDDYSVDWLPLFARAPLLETLDITGQGPDKGFLEALSNVQEETAEQGLSSTTSVPLNHLRVLKLDNARLGNPPSSDHDNGSGSQFVDQLLDWAILRCNYGAPLERLELSSCKYVTAEVVGRIEEVIGEVCWDGWELASTPTEDSDFSDSV